MGKDEEKMVGKEKDPHNEVAIKVSCGSGVAE